MMTITPSTISGSTVSAPSLSAGTGENPLVWTYSDLIDHLNLVARGGSQDVEQEEYKAAARQAYLSVAMNSEWPYVLKHHRIMFDVPYSTGTITYDHTGGTYERMLTLADGTWPEWAQYGRVVVGNVVSPVARRISGSIVTLDDNVNPKEDVAAGTSYTLFRSGYQLPHDYQAGYEFQGEQSTWLATFIEPQRWLARERRWNTTGDPYAWTIMRDEDRMGGFKVLMDGYPATSGTMDFLYYGRGRNIRLTGKEPKCYTGTISSNGATITGSGTAWTNDMVGAMLRIGDANNIPTGIDGLSPFQEQIRIQSVDTGAQTMQLESAVAADAGYSGVKFNISDPIDLDATLIEYIKREAEKQLAIIWKKGIREAVELADRAAYAARERNARVKEPKRAGWAANTDPWIGWWQRGTVDGVS